MARVSFDKVSKSFGGTVAIPELDLVIEAGEFVSLLGPSGCGKTTTLRMLAGLEQPNTGSIRIGDREVNDLPPGKRDIAMVFQSYALYPHMSVAANIVYPLKKRGSTKQEQVEGLRRVADMLQLGPLLDRKPKELSGGQQQRVALGRALVRDPAVFLLDEPLSNLDAKLRAHMRAELIELHRRLGKTMIYVTHDQLEAMTMSDRIAVMKDGRLQQFATPAEIYAKPANSFVAGFIGTPAMTLAPGRLLTGDGADAIKLSGVDSAIPIDAAGMNAAGGEILVGVRPEDVILGRGPWQARVRLVERTGHESIVMLELGASGLTARVVGEADVRIGELVPFDLRVEKLHLFNADDGSRIEREAAVPAAGFEKITRQLR
jgi:multiple sugar transport system ATP-binding protein